MSDKTPQERVNYSAPRCRERDYCEMLLPLQCWELQFSICRINSIRVSSTFHEHSARILI